ncbi:hypothetical protein HDU76_002872 [Blyttiomyces sp. JEL0837]|nr:hypothetical protein HDU76_002872 [Blyttiomyces sp. JEL0837]
MNPNSTAKQHPTPPASPTDIGSVETLNDINNNDKPHHVRFEGVDDDNDNQKEQQNGSEVLATRASVETEIFIQSNKSVDGLFIRRSDAKALGLVELGEAETCYGSVIRYSPVLMVAVSRPLLVDSVFELPQPFEGTEYGGGVADLRLLFSLGVSVAFDRGMIYLIQPGMDAIKGQRVLGHGNGQDDGHGEEEEEQHHDKVISESKRDHQHLVNSHLMPVAGTAVVMAGGFEDDDDDDVIESD